MRHSQRLERRANDFLPFARRPKVGAHFSRNFLRRVGLARPEVFGGANKGPASGGRHCSAPELARPWPLMNYNNK